MPSNSVEESELTGADWFLVTVERFMRASGQGRHVGLSVVELAPGLDEDAFRGAVVRLADASPVTAGTLRKPLFGVPRWTWHAHATGEFPVVTHPGDETWETVGHRLLAEDSDAPVSIHIVPAGAKIMLIVRWRHVFLDGKGAELLLGEIARLAADPLAKPHPQSWGCTDARSPGWRRFLAESQAFRDHFYNLASDPIRSLGGASPRAGVPRFLVERFTPEETARISARATEVSKSMFQIGWFLAAAMRAHHNVLTARGLAADSFQAGCAVQQRKRGAHHPIWQNHVSQLFFSLRPIQLTDLAGAAALLHEQFSAMTRARLDVAFASVAHSFRRIPAWFYFRLLRRNSNGHLTSFFFSHTGPFLPGCETFCGAPITDAWHIPTVCQPPGTGIFFGQRGDALTMTLSWREGSISDAELAALRGSLRADLLGP